MRHALPVLTGVVESHPEAVGRVGDFGRVVVDGSEGGRQRVATRPGAYSRREEACSRRGGGGGVQGMRFHSSVRRVDNSPTHLSPWRRLAASVSRSVKSVSLTSRPWVFSAK